MAKKTKAGFELCGICEREFHISDPQTYTYKIGKAICKSCFLEVFTSMKSWSANRKKAILFEYTKISIPHKLKWSIWKRDGFKCKICKSEDNLSIDHIHPESFGGTLDESNLQTLCRNCNSSKYNRI